MTSLPLEHCLASDRDTDAVYRDFDEVHAGAGIEGDGENRGQRSLLLAGRIVICERFRSARSGDRKRDETRTAGIRSV